MKKNDVPQDHVSTYAGQQKLFYAVDEQGEYTGVKSSGWEVESEATRDAIREIEASCRAAWQRAREGEASPLEFHMLHCRMDLPMLAQTAGIFQWRIKRHFHPGRFKKLKPAVLDKYSEALGLNRDALQSVPDHYPDAE